MKGFFNLFKRSALELKNIRCLTVTAMLIALDLALKAAATVDLTAYLKISFAFIAMASIGMLFGPTVAFFAGMITDLLGFMIRPSGAFDIRFTLIEALGGLLYGLFLYNASNDRWLVPRVIAAKSTVVIICNLLCTTLAMVSLTGSGFFALLPMRAVKSIVELPVHIIILSIVLPVILKAWTMIPGTKRTTDEKLLFSDENVGKAMMTLTALIVVLVCSLGFAAQYLSDQQKDLKARVKEQEETIEKYDRELDILFGELGLERVTDEVPEE